MLAKQKTRMKKKRSVKKSSALLREKPLTQLAIDTTVPGSLFYLTDHSRHMHGQHMLSKIPLWDPLHLNGGGFAVPAPRRAAGCWAGPLLTSHGRSQTYMARDSPQDKVAGSPTPVPVTPAVHSQVLSCLSQLTQSSATSSGWENQPEEQNFALIQVTHLCRDQFEQSLGPEG